MKNKISFDLSLFKRFIVIEENSMNKNKLVKLHFHLKLWSTFKWFLIIKVFK